MIDSIEGDLVTWEQEPMQSLAQAGNLFAFPHSGFWQAMDSLRDKMVLEEMWAKGDAPWKIWRG